MNNDIAHEINNYVNLPKQEKASARKNAMNIETGAINAMQDSDVDMSNSMEILGVMNKAKIAHSTPSVISSCKSFLDDPFRVECYNDLCDSFVERGYNLERAIELTDKFFLALRKENM